MKQYKLLLLTLMLSLLVMLSACSKKPVMDAEPAPAHAVSEAPTVTTACSRDGRDNSCQDYR